MLSWWAVEPEHNKKVFWLPTGDSFQTVLLQKNRMIFAKVNTVIYNNIAMEGDSDDNSHMSYSDEEALAPGE